MAGKEDGKKAVFDLPKEVSEACKTAQDLAMRRTFLEFFYEKKNRNWGEDLMAYWSRRIDEYIQKSKALTPTITRPQEVRACILMRRLGVSEEKHGSILQQMAILTRRRTR